jgi:hypothetical protein
MAILFSKITMRDDYSEAQFFVSGFPKEAEDLEGWIAYHAFLGEIEEDAIVNIHAEAYLYGEGEAFKATPEEVAYMIMRQERDPDFLSGHCTCIGESDFNIHWCPDELFGQRFVGL